MQRKVELHEAIQFWHWYAPRAIVSNKISEIHVQDETGTYDLHFDHHTGRLNNKEDVEFIPDGAMFYVPEYFYREWRDFREKTLSDVMYGEDEE